MIHFVNNVLKKTLPKSLRNKTEALAFRFQSFIHSKEIRGVQANHQKALLHIQKKNRIKVAFFLIHDSIWKYDEVFKKFRNDERFEPIVVICPYTVYGEKAMFHEMEKAYDLVIKKGYNAIKSYNEQTQKWLDVNKELKPDIIFFTNPHKLTKDSYYITNFRNCLTCYAPYNFGNSHLYQMMHNQLFHNYLWRLFAETDFHRKLSVQYARNKGVNVALTGFPGTDVFLDPNYVPVNIWKQKEPNIKKIIWAPHHTIDNNTEVLSYSTFLMFADFMLRLADEYQGKIQIAFKPHPLLKYKLQHQHYWGKDRTELYFNRWNEIENGQYVDGDYTDLFLTSDAMIHDSGSFLIEYLYTGKPVLHLDRDLKFTERLNEFGVQAYNKHYHAKNSEEIIWFIENVLNNTDVKKEERDSFLHSELIPPNQRSASDNIYFEIVKQLY